MAEQVRRAPATKRDEPVDDVAEDSPHPKAVTTDRDATLADIDDLLDEIDDILAADIGIDGQVEEFVKAFQQKGGE
jgi:hypothetical protein